jgi:Ca-activated chloride channel family protein
VGRILQNRRRIWAGLTPLVLAAATVMAASQQQPPVFRGTAETVPVFVTVTEKGGRLVTSLTRDDFLLFDNGKSQPISLFDNTPQPIRLIVLLDVSGSMYGNLGLLRAASRQLFARLRPDDQVRVGTFGDEVTIGPPFTNDPASLEAALPSAILPGTPTPLWAAVNTALDSFPEGGGRRVILVLSDGKDTGPVKFGQPFITLPQVMDRAQAEAVMVYAIGMRSRAAPGQMRSLVLTPSALAADWPDPGLFTLAQETGGGYFEIKPRDDLAEAFARTVDELHGQYLLGFAPPSRDGKRHKIEVKLVPRDLKIRARKNYVAPGGK